MKNIKKEYRVNDQGMIVEEIDHYEAEAYNTESFKDYQSNPVLLDRVQAAV